jgi:hypothetical protein
LEEPCDFVIDYVGIYIGERQPERLSLTSDADTRTYEEALLLNGTLFKGWVVFGPRDKQPLPVVGRKPAYVPPE